MIHLQPIEDRIEIAERKKRENTKDKFKDKFAVWRNHPELYAKERLNINLTKSQTEILYSVKDNRRTAVKAHHALGKTFDAAIAQLWWIDCWDAHIGYITAPTWSQALTLTFKQAKRLAITNKLDFDILDSGIIRDKDNYKATERFIRALNAQNGEGFQGEHTAPILIVIDEATGVPGYIFDAAGGLMTSESCRILEIANPTDETTNFGTHCESENYNVLSFSALDHENIIAELKCEPLPFPGAVSLQWLFEMIRDETDRVDFLTDDCFEFYSLETIENAINGTPVNEFSPKSFYKPTAYFQGRVLGEFPTEASTKVIPKGWLKHLPVFALGNDNKIQLGVDVARFGDDRTTIFARCGSVLLSSKELRKFDHLEITSQIIDVLRNVCQSLGLPPERAKLIPINIDITGGLGTAPFDLLKDKGFNAVGINSSEKANNEQLYRNKRSELWFDIRDRARDKNLDLSRLDLDTRRKLIKELSAPEYKITGGKKVVEEKSETKRRLGYSPDLADGFNLAFYEKPKDAPAEFYSW